jgi:hypothetical protein
MSSAVRKQPDSAASTNRPSPQAPGHASTVRLRNAFTITSHRTGDGREHHKITAPKHGPARAQARRAILAVLDHAEQHHHRVSFLVTLGDYTQRPLHSVRGYDAGLVLLQCRTERDDPYAWLQRQCFPAALTADSNAIIGVDILTWPSPEPIS